MENQYTESTTESWGSRLAGSIKGVLFGFVLFILSFVVLWWNEGRAVQTANGLNEGASIVTDISPNKINDINEGYLVHLSGKVTTSDSLIDDDFNVYSTGLKLKREVEMFQWVEKTSEKTTKNTGGSETTEKTYNYTKEWSNNIENSKEFKITEGHHNPNYFTYNHKEYLAQNAKIGAFTMSTDLMEMITNYESININKRNLNQTNKIVSNIIYKGEGNIDNPHIGDFKISYFEIPEGDYSIIAQQSGDSFTPHHTDNGTIINLLETGIVSSKSMFEAAQSRNNTLTWGLRIFGFFMMFIGISKCFNPFVIMADVIPFLGTLLNSGISIFSGVIAIMLSFITIALAWIVYRPILGVSMIAIGIIIFLFFYFKAYKNNH